MKLALAQYPISYHATFNDWLVHTERWVSEAAGRGADLLVFPEYGSMELVSTFAPETQADLAAQILAMQDLLSGFILCFRTLAKKYQLVIVAPSFPVYAHEKYINRTYVFSPGAQGFQDKWFMTRFETEVWGISEGERVLSVFETAWGRFGVQTCFDIEFPIGAQIMSQHGIDLIVAPSCTETLRGATRVHTGARARAMEQQIYVGVAQTVGHALWSPAVDINYGYAAIYSSPDHKLPDEGILARETPNEAKWLIHTLDFEINHQLQVEAQVFNRKAMHTISMTLGSEKMTCALVGLV